MIIDPPKGHAARSERLPTDFTDVTAGWLTRTLQHRYPGVVVEKLELVELIAGHTTKARVRLTLNAAGLDAGLPADACLKANWSGSPLSGEACVNEARFYKQLREQLPLPSPDCFFADWDDDAIGKQGLILLGDMERLGGHFETSAQPISLDAMAQSLTALAALHGSTWAHPELDRHDWLKTAMATPGDDYWGMMESYYARHNAIPERLAIFPRWMAADPDRARDLWRQLCAYDLSRHGGRCLVHGDAHLGNSYTLADGGRWWFDWQIVRKGHPWRDTTYFMVGSLSVEDRRHGERDLLRHYLDALASYGVLLDFDAAFEDYSRWVIWGLVAWQSNINPKEATMPSLERFCRAADDLDVTRFYRMT